MKAVAKRPALSILFFAGLAVAASGFSTAADAGQKRTVLELFTSQGCSSCPPADALMRKLSADDSVLTLSFAVDYWDYLGWKDTLARKANTERQYSYAARRGDRSVYTPQVVINGRDHAVGSDHLAIARSIRSQEQAHGEAMGVEAALAVAGDAIEIRLKGGKKPPQNRPAKVWLVLFSEKQTVKIQRGENRGKNITYTNVVRDMIPVGSWTGKDTTLTLSRKTLKLANIAYDHCVVIVQTDDRGRPGDIIGVSETERM